MPVSARNWRALPGTPKRAVIRVKSRVLFRNGADEGCENKGFDMYCNQFGFHFDHIDSVHIDWI